MAHAHHLAIVVDIGAGAVFRGGGDEMRLEEAWRSAIADDRAAYAFRCQLCERLCDESFDGGGRMRLRIGDDAAEGEAVGSGDAFGERGGLLRRLHAAAAAA